MVPVKSHIKGNGSNMLQWRFFCENAFVKIWILFVYRVLLQWKGMSQSWRRAKDESGRENAKEWKRFLFQGSKSIERLHSDQPSIIPTKYRYIYLYTHLFLLYCAHTKEFKYWADSFHECFNISSLRGLQAVTQTTFSTEILLHKGVFKVLRLNALKSSCDRLMITSTLK